MPSHAERGMTLIETLVALAILAGVVLSAYLMLAQSTRFAATEQERLIAGVVADNELIELLIVTAPPHQVEEEEIIEAAGRRWRAKRTVSAAGEELLRLAVSVTREGDAQVLARAETLRSAK